MDELTEDDIPGSSLGDREPKDLSLTQLQFWLKCRGIQTTKLKRKAELVTKKVFPNIPRKTCSSTRYYL